MPRFLERKLIRRKKKKEVERNMNPRKKARVFYNISNLFDALPDDIVLTILCKLSSTTRSPLDFISILLTCKRLNRLGLNRLVLSIAGPKTFAIRAKNWSEEAHRFLRLCVNAGNAEASYTLGMIRFYCLKNRENGTSLMAKAAIKSHAPSLYSLAVIQFNGSGGEKKDKDLRAAVALCARAAHLGHVDALRELGHCFQDGYGVPQNVAEGRKLLVQANARELTSILRAAAPLPIPSRGILTDLGYGLSLMSDYGCHVVAREAHPVHMFLTEWFGSRGGGGGLRMCSHGGCGRPETRPNEFRRCSVCGKVNYCSRGCQALDWRLRHKMECIPMEHWMMNHVGDEDDEEIIDDQMVVVEEPHGGVFV